MADSALHVRDLRRRREQPGRVRGGPRRWWTQPGARFNPLFVYGGRGLGKTHLSRPRPHGDRRAAPGWRASRTSPPRAFVNEMIGALRRHQMERFRQRFRGIGTLIVDDIQFLADKKRSQEEFTHTFNALHDGRKQIVIASDRAPHELPGFEDTLRSRLRRPGSSPTSSRPIRTLRLALVAPEGQRARHRARRRGRDASRRALVQQRPRARRRRSRGIEAFGPARASEADRRWRSCARRSRRIAPPIDGAQVARAHRRGGLPPLSGEPRRSSRPPPHGARRAAAPRRDVPLPPAHRRAARRDRRRSSAAATIPRWCTPWAPSRSGSAATRSCARPCRC